MNVPSPQLCYVLVARRGGNAKEEIQEEEMQNSSWEQEVEIIFNKTYLINLVR